MLISSLSVYDGKSSSTIASVFAGASSSNFNHIESFTKSNPFFSNHFNQNTYHPDAGLRSAAEATLKAFLSSSGAIVALLQTAADKGISRDVRIAASIQIKNSVRAYWQPPPEDASQDVKRLPISVQDKETAKVGLVDVLLAETDNAIRSVLAETIKQISEFDFPDNWPALVPTLMANIQTPDVLRMYNALVAMRKIIKRFEYKSAEKRGVLNALMQQIFPSLQVNLVSISIKSSYIKIIFCIIPCPL